jgi:hypothetical protein
MMTTTERKLTQRHQRYRARTLGADGRLVSPRGMHGRHATYRNHGCRCEPCSVAHRAEVARARARRHQRTADNGGIAPTDTHGASTYSNWRCRCLTCLAAWNDRGYWMNSKQRRRLKEHPTGTARTEHDERPDREVGALSRDGT